MLAVIAMVAGSVPVLKFRTLADAVAVWNVDRGLINLAP